MLTPITFSVISESGKTNLFSEVKLNKIREDNFIPELYLDANICLDFVQYADNNLKSSELSNNIQALIAYSQLNKLETKTDYGIMELCMNDILNGFNSKKFKNFKTKISYVLTLPFDLHTNLIRIQENRFLDSEPLPSNREMAQFLSITTVSYLSLLKIFGLAKSHPPSAQTYLKNIESYLTWCDEELDTSMGLEIDLAFEVFGGNSQLWKMLGLQKSNYETLVPPNILSTAWDLTHIRQIGFDLNRNVKLFLITRDKSLLNLFQDFALQSKLYLKNDLEVVSTINKMRIPFNQERLQENGLELLNTFLKKRQGKLYKLEKEESLNKLAPLFDKIYSEIKNCT